MKVKIQQFLFGKNHSWSVTGKNIGRALLKRGHQVDFVSTDGIKPEFVDEDLKPYVKVNPDTGYDCQFSYTAMHNFANYLNPKYGGKRFGLWLYEYDVLPKGWAKYVKHVDRFMIASTFFWDVCVKNKIPPEKMQMMPHGVDWERFENAEPMALNTDKKRKVLVNFAQPHLRKNIPGTLEAFGRAFTSKDDVCLVLKVVDKKPEQQFEVSFAKAFETFNRKFPDHAECIVLRKYVPKIESLYKACDVLFMIPHAEGWFLPAAEMLGAGGVVITSRASGQLDFLNDQNSFLVDGVVTRADRKAMYWESSARASWFKPNIEQAAEKLRYVIDNYEDVHSKIVFPNEAFKKKYSWENNAITLEKLCEEL